MLEESSDELERRETHGLVLAGSSIAVSEYDAVAVGGEDAMVGDSGTEYVGRQVAERTGAVSDGCRVNIPRFLPRLEREQLQQIGLAHQFEEA